MIVIRQEMPADQAAVRRINERAFDGPAEADIVDGLRGAADMAFSLVAECGLSAGQAGGALVGHIVFTRVTVQSDGGSWSALAIGPMAVLPEHQRQGIGSRLVEAGLVECRRRDENVVLVLGHPDYYPRFGFSPAPPRGLRCRWQVPDNVFMVAELAPGALAGRHGLVLYAPAFDAA